MKKRKIPLIVKEVLLAASKERLDLSSAEMQKIDRIRNSTLPGVRGHLEGSVIVSKVLIEKYLSEAEEIYNFIEGK